MDQTSNKPDAGALRRARILGGPLFRTLLSLGIPTIAVLIAQTCVGVLETWYVSFLGTDSLVGVSLVFPISMLMTMMSNGGIGGGVASAVARAIGGGKRREADALVLHAIVVAVVLGGLFTILAWCYGPELYAALGGRGPGLAAAVTYSNYVFAGAIPVWIVNMLCAALRGSGNVRIPAITTFAGALVLIPLSPLLIFGIGAVPGLGIAGAGIAVSLYYSIAAVALLVYMARGHAGLVLTRATLNRRSFSDILRVGALSSIGALQLNLMVVLLTAVVGRFGQAALAGYGIASRLDYVLIPLLFGLGTAVLTVVGTCMGAGDIDPAAIQAFAAAVGPGGIADGLNVLRGKSDADGQIGARGLDRGVAFAMRLLQQWRADVGIGEGEAGEVRRAGGLRCRRSGCEHRGRRRRAIEKAHQQRDIGLVEGCRQMHQAAEIFGDAAWAAVKA